MSPVLGAVVLACLTGASSAFVAYWMGRARGDREARIAQARLASIAEINALVATQLYTLRRRMGHLTPDEATAFHNITTHYGKEAS